jgi:hypothetical protein
MPDIGRSFAAAVANARGEGRLLATAGYSLDASDQVAGALATLWQDGREAGMVADDIHAIADRWTYWDEHGNPWPRALPGNVTPLRR